MQLFHKLFIKINKPENPKVDFPVVNINFANQIVERIQS